MDKFQDKYRITSARLKNWDYRWKASYFITICTQERENYFGYIQNGIMKLSEIGIIADIMWYEIKNHVKNIDLGAFVVMPNHVHGILILKGNESNSKINTNVEALPGDVETLPGDVETLPGDVETLPGDVETLHATSLSPISQLSAQNDAPKNEFMSNISPKSGSVSTIIRSYKSVVTKHAHRLGFHFLWQSRFHDHIIRDEQSFHNISEYIIRNPANWDKDNFYQVGF